MYMRKIAAAAGFATGAALAFAPLASADASGDWLSSFDSLLGGAAPAAAATSDFQISFNGMDLLPTAGNEATATTVAGQFGLAIASGNGASATAEGGTGDYALAEGSDALAKAGSTAQGATGFNYDTAEDIGSNTAGGPGAPDGAYAGGGSLIGAADSATASSNDSAYDFGNNGPDAAGDGGNTGAFAGDGQLIGLSGAGSGDTAYDSGNNLGENDGPAAVDGNNNFASESGSADGTNEGAFSGLGNNNTAIADTSYNDSGSGVSAIGGNSNYAYVYGPDNSTADAGGTSTAIGESATNVGNNDIAYVTDPYGMAGAADSATAGSNSTAAGSSDLAEVLYTHGDASAQGANNLYDIISPFGTSATPAEAAGAVDPAATDISSTVSGEISSLNSMFATDANLFGVGSDVVTNAGSFDTFPVADLTTATGAATPFDYFLYGLDPIANASPDPGAYDLFNGALAKFDDAVNFGVYALENSGAAIPAADFSSDLFGVSTALTTELTGATASQAITDLLGNASSDLAGYFDIGSLSSLF